MKGVSERILSWREVNMIQIIIYMHKIIKELVKHYIKMVLGVYSMQCDGILLIAAALLPPWGCKGLWVFFSC